MTAINQILNGSELIADAVNRSTKAHLFHFYHVLCEIVAIPRKTPTSWTAVSSLRSTSSDASRTSDLKGVVSWHSDPSGEDKVVELDARILVKECLKEIGDEMGMGR